MTSSMQPVTQTLLVISSNAAATATVRESLRDFGGGAFNIECVSEIPDGLERLAGPGREAVAAVIADLRASGSKGTDALDRLLYAARQIPILVVCRASDEDDAKHAIRRGAQDYLLIDQIDGYSLPKALNGMFGRRTCAGAADVARSRPEQAQLTLDSIGDAVVSVDIDGKVTYMNPVAERMTGWPSSEALGRPLPHVLHVIDAYSREPALNPLAYAIRDDMATALSDNCILVRRDGYESAVEDVAAPIHDQKGRVTGAVIVFHDVGAARAMSLRMSHLAQHDFLTQLPNRLLLGERLAWAIAGARRHDRPLAVLYVDVDHFKRINDSHGHAVGDELLKSIAARLRECVRESDTVCRYGGDEFVILLSELGGVSDAEQVADKILIALEAPHHIGSHMLRATVSVGIGVYPDDGVEVETLVHSADLALLRAKGLGRNNRQYFRPDINVSGRSDGTAERSAQRHHSRASAGHAISAG